MRIAIKNKERLKKESSITLDKLDKRENTFPFYLCCRVCFYLLSMDLIFSESAMEATQGYAEKFMTNLDASGGGLGRIRSNFVER